MAPNFIVLLLAALIPMLTGMIWYSNALFGKSWMRLSGVTEEKIKSGNMGIILGLTYVLSLLLAVAVFTMVVHQAHIGSLFMGEAGFDGGSGAAFDQYTALMEQFATSFRTFKHGVLHGVIGAIFFALPVLGINSLFERRGFKYIAIHTGYWALTLGLMGGVICQWA